MPERVQKLRGLWGVAWRGALVLAVSVGVLLLARPAGAHDNLGGDELAMAFWMFAFAVMIAASGVCILWWAIRSGQFTNIEAAKYDILENAPDLDDFS